MHPLPLLTLFLCFFSAALASAQSPPPAAAVPDSKATAARALPPFWRDAWPVAVPLEIEWLGEITQDGVRIRRLRYTGSAPGGVKQRVYALYAAPTSSTAQQKFPAILQIHGGGQTCYPANVAWFVKAGYACLAFDWAGPRDERPADQVTQWVDPVRMSYSDNSNGDPSNLFIFQAVLAARRGIDVLQQQPEVDPSRIGVQGVSWGGLLTWLVAAMDERIRAAVPVYGAGGLDRDWNDMGIGLRREKPVWVDTWTATFDPRNFAHLQHAPILLCNGANDFFGQLATCEALLNSLRVPHVRSYGANRMHSLDPATVKAGMAWFQHYLRGGLVSAPLTPELTFECDPNNRLLAHVQPKGADVERVHFNLARGERHDILKAWLSFPATRAANGVWSAELPLVDSTEPIAVIAQVTHRGGAMFSSEVQRIVPARDVLRERQGPVGRQLVSDVISTGLATSGWYLPRGTDFTHSVAPAIELTTRSLAGRPAITWQRMASTDGADMSSPINELILATRLTADSATARGNQRALELWTHDAATAKVRINYFTRQPGAREYQAAITPGPGWQRSLIRLSDFRPFNEDTDSADPNGPPPANYNECHQLNFYLQASPAANQVLGIGQLSWSDATP